MEYIQMQTKSNSDQLGGGQGQPLCPEAEHLCRFAAATGKLAGELVLRRAQWRATPDAAADRKLDGRSGRKSIAEDRAATDTQTTPSELTDDL
jgi:hypothetical protein